MRSTFGNLSRGRLLGTPQYIKGRRAPSPVRVFCFAVDGLREPIPSIRRLFALSGLVHLHGEGDQLRETGEDARDLHRVQGSNLTRLPNFRPGLQVMRVDGDGGDGRGQQAGMEHGLDGAFPGRHRLVEPVNTLVQLVCQLNEPSTMPS